MLWASFYWFKNGISYTIKLFIISGNLRPNQKTSAKG